MACGVPRRYTGQAVGCDMTVSSLVALGVLGHHGCALDFSIYECQSATSSMFGFIFSFSS